MAITLVLLTAPIAWTFFSPVFRLPALPSGPDDPLVAPAPVPAAAAPAKA